MATTTAFSGFGFVPAGGADCCTCEEVVPCDPCPIECTIEGSPVNLPEYYWLDITVDSSPNCCGGDWASGCWLLRNAQSLFGAGTDPDTGAPNCSLYYAVDPDDVDTVLYAPEGYFDETDGADGDGICGTGFSTTPLIRLIATLDSFLATFTIAEIDAPNSTPTSWTNANNYEFSASPSTIANYCAGPFTLDKISGSVTCWPTEDFPTPPNNTAWPATATLTVADCESPRDCQFNFTPDPCAWLDGPYGVLIVQGTLAGVAIKVCIAFDSGTTPESWIGVQIVDLGCGDVELELKLYCVDGAWWLEVRIDGVLIATLEVTLDDPLGTTGTVSDFISPVCGGSEAMVASISPCEGALISFPCCPDLDPAILCCLDGIPALVINQNFPISDGDGGTATLNVAGSLVWDGTDRWIGDITWTLTGCAFGPIGPYVWEDCEITCDGEGGFTLTHPAGMVSWNTTADCGIVLELSFTGVTTPVLCDASTTTVTLDFESAT